MAGLAKTDPLPPGRYWIDLFPSAEKTGALRCRFDCKRKSLALGPVFYAGCLLTCPDPEVLSDGRALFAEWTSANAATVKVINTEDFPATEPADLDEEFSPPRRWVLFDVTAATAWGMSERIGWPTLVEPDEDIETSDDTVQKPDPEPGLCDESGSLAWLCGPSAKPWVPWVVGGVALALGVVVVRGLR